jgi:DNA-binding response OmpR family regulator
MAKTVLIVEDNPETLEMLRRIIERDGYDTILANDGEKGLDYALRSLPDIIILDRLMPKLNGLQVCRKLKEGEKTRDIPVIFLTILDSEQDIIDGLKAGADDYITKPFSPDELSARIERVLTRYLEPPTGVMREDDDRLGAILKSFNPLPHKIMGAERNIRVRLVKNLRKLSDQKQAWSSLDGELKQLGKWNPSEGRALLARESAVINRFRADFLQARREYLLLQWLVALSFRVERDLHQGENPLNDRVSLLKKLYAEFSLIINRIEETLTVLERIGSSFREKVKDFQE